MIPISINLLSKPMDLTVAKYKVLYFYFALRRLLLGTLQSFKFWPAAWAKAIEKKYVDDMLYFPAGPASPTAIQLIATFSSYIDDNLISISAHEALKLDTYICNIFLLELTINNRQLTVITSFDLIDALAHIGQWSPTIVSKIKDGVVNVNLYTGKNVG